jgi:hypothetical protein
LPPGGVTPVPAVPSGALPPSSPPSPPPTADPDKPAHRG